MKRKYFANCHVQLTPKKLVNPATLHRKIMIMIGAVMFQQADVPKYNQAEIPDRKLVYPSKKGFLRKLLTSHFTY